MRRGVRNGGERRSPPAVSPGRCALDERALVLNRSWIPISTTTVRRAVVLMARGAAAAVHPETYEVADWEGWLDRGTFQGGRIRAPGFEFPVPEVIVLGVFNEVPKIPVAFSRRNVYRRDRFCCVYCGERPSASHLTIDHVVPRSRGGASSWENCVTACLSCNARKADRTDREAGLHLASPPKAPRWPGGFDPTILSGRTAWQRFLPTRWQVKWRSA